MNIFCSLEEPLPLGERSGDLRRNNGLETFFGDLIRETLGDLCTRVFVDVFLLLSLSCRTGFMGFGCMMPLRTLVNGTVGTGL
jgi:hypothetical protein